MPYKRYGRRILAILLAGILFITNFWGLAKHDKVHAADAKNYANRQTVRKSWVCMMAPRTVLSRIICLLFPMETFV